jgi:hypothetical protein
MTIILNEKYENTTDYDDVGWTEVVSGTNTYDPNADTVEVSSPDYWGQECLKIDVSDAASNCYGFNIFITRPITYTRIEIIVTAESYVDDEFSTIAFAQDTVSGKNAWILYLRQTLALGLHLMFNPRWDNGDHVKFSNGSQISLNTKYIVEVKWDVTGADWEWKINGVVLDTGNDEITGAAAQTVNLLLIGTVAGGAANYTACFGNIMVDDTQYPDKRGLIEIIRRRIEGN